MKPGKLYIVATPIGNLQDITARAIETLQSVNVILCEDTRVTRVLLNHYQIQTPTLSYHQHSPESRVRLILDRLEAGENVALVSDAGTPGISDPGNELIGRVVTVPDEPITIEPIPGPSAVVSALSICGFPTDKFLFLGFPPHKKGRQTFFKTVAASEYTTVFYESNHRIIKCLNELAAVLDEKKQVCVCRELTKKFESVYRGTIKEIIEQKIPEKGEFVVVIN